jgi:hypothetical protein
VTDAAFLRESVCAPSGSKILERKPHASKHGNVVGARAAWPQAGQHLAKFGMNGFIVESSAADHSHLHRKAPIVNDYDGSLKCIS